MASDAIRKWAVVLAVACALGAPASQALLGWGLTAAEFARQGDQTLRAAGYAFSIWGLIYLGLLAYALYQLRSRGRLAAALGWPVAAASLGCGLWILASGLDAEVATVAIILVSAVAVIWGLAGAPRARAWPDRLLALWPASLLAGWLTAASTLNLLTVATSQGLVGPAARTPAALAGLAVTFVVASLVAWRLRNPVYALPVAWGLAAVAVAERPDQPAAALAAGGAAVLLLGLAAWLAVRRSAQ